MNAKKTAVCAVFVALLIAAQFCFGMLPGVELVTVFLLCFCYAFGICMGMIAATAFSLLRCIIFGFSPNVLALYLIYYNLFAALFGAVGRKSVPPWACIPPAAAIAAVSAYFAAAGLPVSAVYAARISAMLWVIFALCALICVASAAISFKRKGGWAAETVSVTVLAVVCTVVFTLLDDVISPLFYGYTLRAAQVYFLASLYVMTAQSLCVLISVLFLFRPLVTIFRMVKLQ